MPDHVQFKLNLPADVKAWLREQAAKNVRSQGSEIVACLRERMERQDAQTA
ncbi:MAG: Arc family DNA-binding protein [Paracoccus sp. (in: a-proteobacteria)]|uniref:Arc family DNA-binding protein n=1 Tax=Paracoccus sp. TaxID=267 RepID=UPI00391A3051